MILPSSESNSNPDAAPRRPLRRGAYCTEPAEFAQRRTFAQNNVRCPSPTTSVIEQVGFAEDS
jgi:hypothetical protein